ncbi:MAG: PQQ-binding-like beta-propeller repeat protein [bacterium]
MGAEAARRALRSARRSGEAQSLLEVYRRRPWSAAGAEALLEFGERLLREGGAGLAARSFRDVLTHGADGEVRAKARVGLWLALASDRAALERAFEDVEPDRRLPWMGRPTPASTIRKRLLAGAPTAAQSQAPALAELDRRQARMPPAAPWPREAFDPEMPKAVLAAVAELQADLQVAGDHVLVCGPNVLCAYRGDLSQPQWLRTSTLLHGFHGGEWENEADALTIPGRFRPTVADGRLYTRWGLAARRRLLRSVAAFDVATGRMLWSTAGDPAWADAWPIGDPAVADGRVYVLTAPASHTRVLPILSVSLACLDADDGRLLWSRRLASHTFTLLATRDSPFRGQHFDLVHYGNAVTVRDGAVYCSTNLGFAARCDARDGAVEWTWSYPRARVGHNALRLARRLGAAPMVVGDAVVLAPRDYPGVFALDRGTGERRWVRRFAVSDYAVGAAGPVVLLGDGHHVAALHAATGETRWRRRFAEGILGRPRLVGSSVYLGSASGLWRLATDTGQVLERAEWGKGGSMRAFALRGRRLVGLTEQAAGALRRGAGTPLNPQAPGGRQELGLPMKRSWSLLRPNPRLVVPPAEAKVEGRVFLLSENALECVAMTARGAVVWRRLLALGFKALAWAPKTLLFIYPRRAVAVDAESGALRWEQEVEFPIHRWTVAGPYLVLRRYERGHRSRRTAAVEIASGTLLWDRGFRGLGHGNDWDDHLPHVAWDGRRLHMLGYLSLEDKGYHDVVIRPSDGRIVEVRRVLEKLRKPPEAMVLEGTRGFYLSESKIVYEFSLDDGRTRRHGADLRDLTERHLRRFEMVGPWLWVQEDNGRDERTVWILRRGDPGYELRRERTGLVADDRLYEIAGDHRLVVTHLPSRREEQVYQVPPTRGFFNRILDFYEVGDALLVVSGLDAGHHWDRRAARLRVDTFDRSSGRHRDGQVLRDVAFWEFETGREWPDNRAYQTQAAWHEGVLCVTDLHGLHAFAPAEPDALALERRVHVAYRASPPVVPDGSLGEWRGTEPVKLTARGRPAGRLLVAHDGERLCLAVACRDADARPRRGRGDYGAGDWLEVGVTAGERSTRFGMGLDPRGRVVWEPFDSQTPPQGLDGQVGGDPAARERVYELTVPLKSLAGDAEAHRLREIGLSVTVWDEEPGQGTVRAYTWGSALLGRSLLPFRHERVRLHPLTGEAQEAGLALARELPWLPHSWAFFRDQCRTHAESPSTLKALHRDFLRRHREGPVAVRALAHLDQLLRDGLDGDPSREVLELARRAGVVDEARRRYKRLTEIYLSQWVHIDPKSPPESFLIQLDHDPDSGGAEHRVFWGRNVWREGALGTPSRRDGGALPPAGKWVELRVPLLWLDSHDKPIHGFILYQRAGHKMYWDRTAVGRPGKEHVFIEDDEPEGKRYGNWRWVGHLRRSGRRAHTEPQNLGKHSTSRRAVLELEQPVVEHLLPQPPGPYLSQWVYIAKPTEMLTLDLHDGQGWGFGACWGKPHRERLYVGPLPRKGSWQELRLPLDRVQHRPIRGIRFGRDGGKVYWDRTTLVVGDRKRVLLDDELPEGHYDENDWAWVEKPARSGQRAHTLKPESGGWRAHDIHSLEQPVVDHVPFRAEQAVAALRRHLPVLGSTRAAWHFFEDLLRLSPQEPRRRIEQYTWFLRHFPDHEMAIHVLTRLLAHHRDLETPDPEAAVDAVIAAHGVSDEAAYTFRRKHLNPEDCFLQEWLVLGPFPNEDQKGFGTVYPPETEPVELRRTYRGTDGPVRWRRVTAEENAVRLHKLLEPSEFGVAYAACWVHSPRSRAASLEIGTDDGCKVWVNRKLVFSLLEERAAEPRQNIVPIRLRRGANELLLKIEQGQEDWEFYVELVGGDGRSLLDQVRVSPMPSAGR